MKNLVFIGSGGRTGTKFFGEMLNTVIDDCWSEHEPDMIRTLSVSTLEQIRRFGFQYMVSGRLLGATGLRPLGCKLLTGRVSEHQCAVMLRRSRARYHATISQSLVIESYSRWWMFVGVIHRIWPEAKIIGIIRDPRDWVESWLRHRPLVRGGDWKEWLPPGPLTPISLGDSYWAERWPRCGPVGRLAWDWKTIYTHLDGAARVTPNMLLFRFEDLFDSTNTAARELVEFSAKHSNRNYRIHNFEGFTATALNASTGPRRSWREWSAKDVREFDELCGPLMRKYGYGFETDWQTRLDQT